MLLIAGTARWLGDLGSTSIQGRNYPTKSLNFSHDILKLYFQSSYGSSSLRRLSHHWSVWPF